MEDTPDEHLITRARKARRLTLAEVADAVGTDQSTLSRIEKGQQMPRRELARALHAFYRGRVPLGSIYDPEYQPAARTAAR